MISEKISEMISGPIDRLMEVTDNWFSVNLPTRLKVLKIFG